jgi:hypothetical protein
LEFHHKPGTVREFCVQSRLTHSKARLIKELKKCELRCRQCHSDAHFPSRKAHGTRQRVKPGKRDNGPSLDWLTDGVPEHELYQQENVDIFPAAPRTFGKRTHDESAEPYSREELIRDKTREDARTIDGEDI